MCDTCHAGCCRAYNLLITVFDALQISRDLSLPIGEFVAMLPRDAAGAKRFGDLHRPLRFSDPGFEDTFFYIGLKQIESRLIPGTVRCHFLQEWPRAEVIPERGSHPGAKIAGRCGIYGSRPMMCRAYPSFLHKDGALGMVANPADTPMTQANEIYTLCPDKWTLASFGSDTTQVVHQLVLNRYEIDFQNKLIDEWNARPRSLKEFFPFAVACYSGRFRVIPEMVTTPSVGQPATPAAEPAPIPD